jgi:hypothetical protein
LGDLSDQEVHRERSGKQSLSVEVYDDRKWSAANQRKNAVMAEKNARKCVAVGLGVEKVSDTSYTVSKMH